MKRRRLWSTCAAIVLLVLAASSAVAAQEDQEPVTIFVSELRFSGAVDLLRPDERAAFASTVVGGSVPLSELEDLVDGVTALLLQKGLLLSFAYIPPQDVTTGVVEIVIFSGTLGEIEFNRGPGTRVRDATLRGALGRRIDPEHLLARDLESALLRLNDLPGVSAVARLEAGAVPGTARLVIDIDQEGKTNGELSINNRGDDRMGWAQYTLVARLVDLTGRGDETLLQGMLAPDTRLVRLSGGAPLGSSGLTGRLEATHLTYEMLDDAGAGLAGTASTVGASLDGAVLRSRSANVWAGGGVRLQALIDDSAAGRLGDKRALSGAVWLAGDRSDAFGGGGVSAWQVEWTVGYLDLSRNPDSAAADASGLKTQGTFQRLSATANRLQELPGPFSLRANLAGQWAGKNLDSSQEFSLGGPNGIRSYPTGEGSGDEGFVGNVEVRYIVPVTPAWGSLALSAFVDAGRIRLHKEPGAEAFSNACNCNEYSLSGAGLGLIWTYGRFTLEASWAHALGDNPGRSVIDGSEGDDGRRLWLAGTYRF